MEASKCMGSCSSYCFRTAAACRPLFHLSARGCISRRSSAFPPSPHRHCTILQRQSTPKSSACPPGAGIGSTTYSPFYLSRPCCCSSSWDRSGTSGRHLTFIPLLFLPLPTRDIKIIIIIISNSGQLWNPRKRNPTPRTNQKLLPPPFRLLFRPRSL